MFEKTLQQGGGVLVALLLWGGIAVADAAAQRLSQITGPSETFSVADGLQEPEGLSLDRESGDLYVAERGAGRVSVIRDGTRTTVIETGWTVDEDSIPAWAVTPDTPREFLTDPQLHQPGSIAFSSEGHLFVGERRAYGRLLEFIPDEETGAFTKAKLVPTPWIDKPFAWDDVKVTPDGKLFVVGYDEKGVEGLHFGTVLMRALDDDWWIIDYGPFSRFAALYLSRRNDILVVCERTKGELVAWDIERHLPIGTVPRSVDQNTEAGSACLLKDGSYVVAEVSPAGQSGNSRLVRVDPVTAQASGIAEGFQRIGGIELDAETGHLFVSDAAAGRIAEVRPDKEVVSEGAYLLQRSLEAFESEHGFSPRVAPAFINNFLAKIGGAPSGDRPQSGGSEKGEPTEDVLFSSSFTLREFATQIPLVAGKVQTMPEDQKGVEDPVEEIEFLLFFPAHVVRGTDMATPSLSFFSARRASGKVEQSRLLMGGLKATARVGDQWLIHSDNASIYVPIATCSLDRYEDGMDLNLAFLGMGIYDDYYMRLTTGKVNKGSLIVEGRFGGRSEYNLSFVEKPQFGGEPVKNLVVAGFDPAVKGEELGWLNIGQWPVGSALAIESGAEPRFASVEEEITEAIRKKELERRLSAGVAVTGSGDERSDDAGSETEVEGATGVEESPLSGAPTPAPAGEQAP